MTLLKALGIRHQESLRLQVFFQILKTKKTKHLLMSKKLPIFASQNIFHTSYLYLPLYEKSLSYTTSGSNGHHNFIRSPHHPCTSPAESRFVPLSERHHTQPFIGSPRPSRRSLEPVDKGSLLLCVQPRRRARFRHRLGR